MCIRDSTTTLPETGALYKIRFALRKNVVEVMLDTSGDGLHTVSYTHLFSDQVLRNIGRRHTAQDILDCYRTARAVGHDNINMDLIACLLYTSGAEVALLVDGVTKLTQIKFSNVEDLSLIHI